MAVNFDTRISLSIGTDDYKSWKSISISRSVIQMAGEFSFTTSNLYERDLYNWRILLGSECKVKLEGTIIITGYIDDVSVDYDSESYNITFKGRDKTSDLVDCSYDFANNPNEFLNQSILQIITKLCKPFNIDVIIDGELKINTQILNDLSQIKPTFAISPGEKIFEVISELCAQFAVMPITNGDGQLHLARVGTEVATDRLEGKVNIKSANLNQSHKEMYSDYYINGWTKPSGEVASKDTKGHYYDPQIKRHRPLVIPISEAGESDGICQTRAEWEGGLRSGASVQIGVTVQGWTQSNKKPWRINSIVRFNDKYIGIKESLLIAQINLSLDDSGGEITQLGLMPTETFTPKKRAEKAKKLITPFDEEWWLPNTD